MFYDEKEVEQDGQIYIEKSVPLWWGCLILFAFLVAFGVGVSVATDYFSQVNLSPLLERIQEMIAVLVTVVQGG